jgi:hypothetical protein
MSLVAAAASASDLFSEEAVLEAGLTGPLDTLIAGRAADSGLPFTLTVDGAEHRISVSLRGKSRLRVCEFPPLRLRFPAAAAAGTIFEGYADLRLVTHCLDSDRGEQNLLLEYAAYRILNLLTENSYRVRLLRISYSDDRAGDDLRTRFGFLIEPSGELADRIDAERVHVDGISRSALQPEQAAIVYVFQYLIGNTDWSLVKGDDDPSCCFNGNLFAAGTGLLLVPHDFDLSGLVDARYARPDPSLRISRVTQRLYRGYCIQPEALETALRRIVDKRSEILGLIEDTPGLSRRETAAALKFLDGFFRQAGNPRRLLKSFGSRCL